MRGSKMKSRLKIATEDNLQLEKEPIQNDRLVEAVLLGFSDNLNLDHLPPCLEKYSPWAISITSGHSLKKLIVGT